MATKKPRAWTLLAKTLVKARSKDGFVPRQTLINVLLKSKYAGTAESKLSGYMNDIRVYGGGELEMYQAEHSRLYTAYRLTNKDDFDPQTGFNLSMLPEQEVEEVVPAKKVRVSKPERPMLGKRVSGPRTDQHLQPAPGAQQAA